MRVEVISKNSCKKELKIEVEPEHLKEDYTEICSRYQRQARVPGFRKGKTPLSIILQRFKNEIREDLIESSVQKYFVEAVKAENLNPLASPHIHDLSYSEGQPLSFTAEFEVLPRLDISNYKGLEIERIPVEVKEEEVDGAIDRIRERMAQFTPIEGRAVATGDFAVISYTGEFTEPGRKQLEAKEIYCEAGSNNTLAEFNENLLGAQVGDEKSFNVKYPEDFPNKELAGHEVRYQVQLLEIKQKRVPELTDDFARDAGQFSSLEEMRQKIREELVASKQKAAESDMQEKLVEMIIQSHPFEVPDVMVNKQAENRLHDYVRSLIVRGIHPQTLDINWADFQARQKELAVTDVKVALVLEHIAERENITVTEEELDANIAEKAREAQQSFEAVKSRLTRDGATDRIKDRIRNKKSLDRLFSLATLKDPQGVIVQP